MQVSIQTDKKNKRPPPRPPSSEQQQSNQNEDDEQHQHDYAEQQKQKNRRIKKLTQVNRQLIERLKQQNEDLTKKINKQKLKPNRSLSVKTSPKYSTKEVEGTKRELANAYKQIDMYKSVITNLKAKEISIQSIDKINQLENKVKYEEGVIDEMQKQIKFLSSIKDQQEKELKVYENDEIKGSVLELEKEVVVLKQKIKTLKKNAQKRQEIEKKQQAYQIQLEKQLRKLNDQYYPGKDEKKKSNMTEDYQQKTERDWQLAKEQLAELRKIHQENGKKIDALHRQKNRELKSHEQNQLKIKQKGRKLYNLKNKLAELTKLVNVRSSAKVEKGEEGEDEQENDGQGTKGGKKGGKVEGQSDEKKEKDPRQVKRWKIPDGYCLQKGKIMPDSIFFSDKTEIKKSKKSKITKIYVWYDQEEWPCLMQIFYKNQKSDEIQGLQPLPSIPSNLEMGVLALKQGDYVHKICGSFINGQLAGIQFISKFGRQLKIESETANSEGQKFIFEPKPNEIPSCMYGAIVRKPSDDIRICHLGFEFMTDW